MEAQTIRTKRDDDVRQCIEAAIARRKDEFALRDLVWTADGYGYIVKFRLGLADVVRTAVQMLVFEESSGIDRMLDGVRLTFKALASSSDAFVRREQRTRLTRFGFAWS
jgi:hypothetical protein